MTSARSVGVHTGFEIPLLWSDICVVLSPDETSLPDEGWCGVGEALCNVFN